MSKRNLVVMFVAVCLCCSAIPQALAQDNESLDYDCRQAQLDVQAAVEAGGPYSKHGHMMRLVSATVMAFEAAGDIDSVCASCIVHQFARRIPIALQEPCGPDSPDPECEGATCETFTPCNLPNNCTSPVCVTIAEGGGVCVEGTTPCDGLIRCPAGTGDCPPGSVCAVSTCCVDPVCVPESVFCPEGGGAAPAAAPAGAGPTIGGVDQ